MKTFNQVVGYSFFTLGLLFTLFYTANSQATSTNETAPVSNITGTQSPNISINVTPGILSNNNTNSSELATPEPPQKPPPALGLSCNESSECKAEFSSCVYNICTCQTGYINSIENLRCLKVVMKLGDGCSEDEQCIKGLNKTVGPTTCLNFKCSCAIGMSFVDNKCQGPTVLNSKCETDDECTILKSHCRDGFCACFLGFIPNGENNLCLPLNLQLQKMNSGCLEDLQCKESMGDDAICEVGASGGVCQCQPGTHLVKTTCTPYKDLDASCSQDIECVTKDFNTESPDSRICNNNVCKCNKGWIQVDNICKSGASRNAMLGSLISTVLLFWLLQRK